MEIEEQLMDQHLRQDKPRVILEVCRALEKVKVRREKIDKDTQYKLDSYKRKTLEKMEQYKKEKSSNMWKCER